MKITPHSNHFIVLLLVFLVACETPSTSIESIAKAAYYQDSALLATAWQLPVAQKYKERFEYQVNGMFCGPATLTNFFHSVGRLSFTQENLFERSTVSYWKARFLGLTLDELAALIRENAPLKVTVLRDLTLSQFREEIRQANDLHRRYLINFNRHPLFGVSIGHHSPIGGYLEDRDLVFVLDVLDDYRPYLVPTARLYEAMDTVDTETGKKRGLLRIMILETDKPTP